MILRSPSYHIQFDIHAIVPNDGGLITLECQRTDDPTHRYIEIILDPHELKRINQRAVSLQLDILPLFPYPET